MSAAYESTGYAPVGQSPQSIGNKSYQGKRDHGSLLTEKEIAKFLKVSVSWLQKARVRGDGPPFVRISGGCIRYQISAVQEWVQSKIVHSTSQYPNETKGDQ